MRLALTLTIMRVQGGEGGELAALYRQMSLFGEKPLDPLRDDLPPGSHPVTYGDVTVDPVTGAWKPVDTVLTEVDERGCRASVDYMLFMAPFELEAKGGVERFEVEAGKPYRFCSDHYAIVASVGLN